MVIKQAYLSGEKFLLCYMYMYSDQTGATQIRDKLH